MYFPLLIVNINIREWSLKGTTSGKKHEKSDWNRYGWGCKGCTCKFKVGLMCFHKTQSTKVISNMIWKSRIKAPVVCSMSVWFLFLSAVVVQVSAGELERLMVRLPSMFRQELSGVGATLEKRWKFCGFDTLSSAWHRSGAHTHCEDTPTWTDVHNASDL